MTMEDHEGFASKRHYVAAHVNDMDVLPDDITFICYEYLE